MDAKYFTQLDLRGHECERRDEVDELLKIMPGDTCLARFSRWWTRKCLISERNNRSYKYMRSQSAINYEKNRQIRQYHWMIHPFSEFRVVYEIIMMIIFTITLLGYRSSYDLFTLKNEPTLHVLNYIMLPLDLMCFIGIIINFRTGHLVTNTKEVYLNSRYAAKYYLRGYFWIDFITAIPYHLFKFTFNYGDSDTMANIFDLIACLRFLRIFPLHRFYRNTVEVYGLSYVVSKIIWISYLTVLFIHSSACFHFLVAKIVQSDCPQMDDKSWVKVLCDTSKTERFDFYIASLFRAFSNTFHVGYGLTAPHTNEDMLVTTIFLVFGSVLSVCVTVTFMNMINVHHTSSSKYFKMSTQVQCYMQSLKLPPRLQGRVVSYYDFRFHRSFFREDEIMSSITGELRQDIMLNNCQRLVENVSFFSNIPMAMMVRIVAHMRSEFYLPNDVVIKHGDKGKAMFFIKSGTVAIYTDAGTEVCHLEDGAHFGEISLVMGDDRRVATVIAVECSWVFRLDKEDFLRAVSPFPDLLARITAMARERLSRTEEMHVIRGSRISSVTRARKSTATPEDPVGRTSLRTVNAAFRDGRDNSLGFHAPRL